jgi:hypothetical protein
MINWTDADNRMQTHLATTDRINRRVWEAEGDAPTHARTIARGAGLGRRIAGAVLRLAAFCREAGRSPAAPAH